MTNDGHRSQGQTIIMPEGTWREVPPVTVAAASPPSCPARRWGLVVFVCGAAFATYGSLVPFDFDLSRKESIGEWIRAVPHRLSFDSGRVDFFSNVCLFIPVGLGGMAWLARNVRSARAVIPLVVVMLLALGLGLLNEGGQTLLPSRVASYSDVAAQLLGALLGCLSWVAFGPLVRGWLARLQTASRGDQRLVMLLEGYLVFQFCMSVFPLDVTIHPTELYQKLERGRINLIPFVGLTWSPDLVAEMLFFTFTSIPYGMLATRLWVPSATKLRNIPDSVALGMGIVFGIELCQLFIRSRFTDATQVVMGAGGVLLGVLLMHAFWPRGEMEETEARSWRQFAGTWYAAAMLYAFVPAAFLLWPYEFVFDGETVRQNLHEMMGIPFARMMRQSPLPMSTVVIRDLLLYWPFGLLLGAGIGQTKRGWRPVFACIGMALIISIPLGIELLQSLVPGRSADITDVLISAVAGMTGMGGWILGKGVLSWSSHGGDIASGSH